MNRRSFVTRASALLAGIAAACSGGAIRLAEAQETFETVELCRICQTDDRLIAGDRIGHICGICMGIGKTLYMGQPISPAMCYHIRELRKQGAIHVLKPDAGKAWDFTWRDDAAPEEYRLPVDFSQWRGLHEK